VTIEQANGNDYTLTIVAVEPEGSERVLGAVASTRNRGEMPSAM